MREDIKIIRDISNNRQLKRRKIQSVCERERERRGEKEFDLIIIDKQEKILRGKDPERER